MLGSLVKLAATVQPIPTHGGTTKMHLVLSSNSPTNTVFSTDEGQALYKVETPFKLVGKTSTIRRVIPNDIGGADEHDVQGRFAHLAQIEWKALGQSTLRYEGSEVDIATYLRKEGFGWHGWDRVFTAPDGRDYRWHLGMNVPELTLNDGSKTPVAKFHRQHLGVFKKARNAYLEVLPAGEHIVDAIMVTFVYIEKKRRDKKRAARSSGGGGSFAGRNLITGYGTT